MATMQHVADPVNPDLDFDPGPADDRPGWLDEAAWGADPDPDDAAWAAQAFGDPDDDDPDEGCALEAAATDAMAWGLIPRDMAEGIARTSLVGLADEMADAYCDEAERVSGRRPSRDEAGRNVSLAWFRHSANPQS